VISLTKSKGGKPTERRKRKRPPASDIGTSLRLAYERTLAEDVPPEMLDLLGKLD